MIRPLALAALALTLAGAVQAADTVQLKRLPRLGKDADAMPRIAAPLTPATLKINAALARLDARWIPFARDCLGHGKPSDVQVTRAVTTPMTGPGYLTIVAHDSASCDQAAHPDSSTLALTYDLATGRPVNWQTLLGRKLAETATLDSNGDGTTIGVISGGTLHDLYVAAQAGDADPATRKECADVLEDETMQFQVWLDARKGGLVAAPSSLPHAVAACADEEVIPVATLRRLGADPALLAALEAAHRAAR